MRDEVDGGVNHIIDAFISLRVMQPERFSVERV